jgi:hypothetical protein
MATIRKVTTISLSDYLIDGQMFAIWNVVTIFYELPQLEKMGKAERKHLKPWIKITWRKKR